MNRTRAHEYHHLKKLIAVANDLQNTRGDHKTSASCKSQLDALQSNFNRRRNNERESQRCHNDTSFATKQIYRRHCPGQATGDGSRDRAVLPRMHKRRIGTAIMVAAAIMAYADAQYMNPHRALPGWTHYPCLIVVTRHGYMDEDGTVHRPENLQTQGMVQDLSTYCDLVALGRFTAVHDEHFNAGLGRPNTVVTATFRVAEVMLGETDGPVRVGMERRMLAFPGDEQNRVVRSYREGEIRHYRRRAALDGLELLEGVYEAGRPLTARQHGRIAELLQEAAWGSPAINRYQPHKWVDNYIMTSSGCRSTTSWVRSAARRSS